MAYQFGQTSSYHRADGVFADLETIGMAPQAGTAVVGGHSITADDTSVAFECGHRTCVRLDLVVASNAATSLDVTIQASSDGTNWYTAGTFAQVTTPASERKTFVADRFMRASHNHTGSGAIVFSLTGEAA